MLRLFEQPLMRTIQFVGHWRLFAFGLGAREDAFFNASVALQCFSWCKLLRSYQAIDLTITWCKVNVTKKIREFRLMSPIRSE
jgi:hypothetical protein